MSACTQAVALSIQVRSQTSGEAAAITHKSVHQLKRALQSMLRDEDIKVRSQREHSESTARA